MPTITATPFTTEAYVRIDADWSDMPEVVYAGVQRTNTVTGETVLLRPYVAYDGEGNLLLSCSQGLWYDTEPPLNVALTYCLIASDVQTLLSQNPSFETGTAPWTASGGVLTQSATYAHDGTFSGLLTPNGTSAGSSIRHPTITGILADIPVTVSAWVLTPQGFNAFQIGYTFTYDNGLTQAVVSNTEILDDLEWTYVSVTMTPASAASITSLSIHTLGVAPNTTLFYVDQFQVTQQRPVTVNACTTLTLTDLTTVRLKDPVNPCSDVIIGLCSPLLNDCEEDTRISYAGQAGAQTRPANSLVIEPTDREFPIPESRSRRSPRTELRLIAHDENARDDLLQINAPGSVLLLQLPPVYHQEDRYISVGDFTENYISIDQREQFRLMNAPYITVGRPDGASNGVCGTRLQDMCDLYTSWSAMVTAGLTWVDLLLGEASNDGPGSDPSELRTWDEVDTEFASWDAVHTGGRTWDGLRDGT